MTTRRSTLESAIVGHDRRPQEIVIPQLKTLISWIIGVGTIIVGLMAGYQRAILSEIQDTQHRSEERVTSALSNIVDKQRELATDERTVHDRQNSTLENVARALERATTRLDIIDSRGTLHEQTAGESKREKR